MSKESKVLLAVMVVLFVLTNALMLFLNRQSIGVTLGTAKVVKQAVETTPVATPVPSESASPSASVKAKATVTVKPTVKATATPEASVEDKPEQ